MDGYIISIHFPTLEVKKQVVDEYLFIPKGNKTLAVEV